MGHTKVRCKNPFAAEDGDGGGDGGFGGGFHGGDAVAAGDDGGFDGGFGDATDTGGNW